MPASAPIYPDVPLETFYLCRSLASWFKNKTQVRVLEQSFCPPGGFLFVTVKHYSTYIFTAYDMGKYWEVELNTGGHRTATTKRHINNAFRCLGAAQFYINQVKWEWYLSSGEPFTEGMRVIVCKNKTLNNNEW